MQTLYTMNLERHAQIHPRVLLHQFDGAIDAGNAANLATEQLLTTLPGKAVATFNIDALIDYRARRPTISYDHGKFHVAEGFGMVWVVWYVLAVFVYLGGAGVWHGHGDAGHSHGGGYA